MGVCHLFLECGIEPAVVDAESDKLHVLAFDGASGNGGVLLLKVVGEFGAIMPTVGFGEHAKVSVLVLWELRIESLDQFPDVGSCSRSTINRVATI